MTRRAIEKARTNHRGVLNKMGRDDLKCGYCAPNEGCNAQAKRQPRADKYKSKRKGRA